MVKRSTWILIVENTIKCEKCETCQPDQCLKRSVNDKGRIIQHKTSFPCGSCRNYKNYKKVCQSKK